MKLVKSLNVKSQNVKLENKIKIIPQRFLNKCYRTSMFNP